MEDNVNLNKWPALLVVGDKITKEQAREILIRTDQHRLDFSCAGNNKINRKRLIDMFGVQDYADRGGKWCDYYDYVDEEKSKLKIIDLEYLSNSRIISTWIGGAKGWCDWDGNIFCNNYNIGKWPSEEEVLNDWKKIAKSFPFLNITTQLMGEEAGFGGNPLIEFRIKNGKVTKRVPKQQLIPSVDCGFNIDNELGISLQQLEVYLKEYKESL